MLRHTEVAAPSKPQITAIPKLCNPLQTFQQSLPSPPHTPQVRSFSVLVDYKPRRVDVAALRDGSLLELVNLVPWGGVDVGLKGLRLAGVQGWDGLAAAAAQEWLQDIATTQVGGEREGGAGGMDGDGGSL